MIVRPTLTLATLLALLGACSAFAQSNATPAPQPPSDSAPAQASEAPVSSGLRVYIDPQTGRRTSTPTAEQRAAAAAQDALNFPVNAHDFFTTEILPGGGVLLRTHGRNQSVVLARPGPHGPEVQCTDPLHAHAPIAPRASATPEER